MNNVNSPPSTPILRGPSRGTAGTIYNFSTYTIDQNNDLIFIWFDWGDDNSSGWLGPYNSAEECNAFHTWTSKGNYEIKVKAKDIYGAESGWSDPLPITMPYSYNKHIQPFLELLFQRFPHAFAILRNLLRY